MSISDTKQSMNALRFIFFLPAGAIAGFIGGTIAALLIKLVLMLQNIDWVWLHVLSLNMAAYSIFIFVSAWIAPKPFNHTAYLALMSTIMGVVLTFTLLSLRYQDISKIKICMEALGIVLGYLYSFYGEKTKLYALLDGEKGLNPISVFQKK